MAQIAQSPLRLLASPEGKPARGAGSEKAVSVEMILYFTAVAEEMSFTRAAKRMHIDQSWLSHKIRQMEGLLQCFLFTRSTRHIELTPAGEALLEYGQKLTRAAEEAQKAAALIGQQLRSILRIGALPYGFWYPERVELSDRFETEHPETAIEVVNGTSAELLEKLRRGELDIAFVCGPFDANGLEVLTIAFDHYSLLIPAEDKLAKKPQIFLEDLKARRMVTIHSEMSPSAYEDLFGPFVRAGVIPVPSPEFQDHAMKSCAARQRIMHVCNNRALGEAPMENMVPRLIADHEITSPKNLVRRPGHRTAAIDEFWSLAQEKIAAPTAAVRKKTAR
jgi:DNA-binding transcriptional LysR family regulator